MEFGAIEIAWISSGIIEGMWWYLP